MNTKSCIKRSRIALFQLLCARMFSGLTKPALKLLITKAGPLGLQYPNEISFCNVLFVGNVCASIIPLLLGGKTTLKELRSASITAYFHLVLGIINAALFPSLLFFALIHGNLINIILILRFKGIAYAIFSYLFYKTTILKSDFLGYVIIVLGLSVLIFSGGIKQLGVSGLLAFLSSLVKGFADVNDKKSLQYFSTMTYLFLTNFFSSLLFFVIVIMFFGFSHFWDAFHGELWGIMLVYAGIGIMLSLFLWLKGVKFAKPVMVANVALISPLFTILFTYLLLNEVPSITQIIALAIILGGLLIARLATKIDHLKVGEAPGSA